MSYEISARLWREACAVARDYVRQAIEDSEVRTLTEQYIEEYARSVEILERYNEAVWGQERLLGPEGSVSAEALADVVAHGALEHASDDLYPPPERFAADACAVDLGTIVLDVCSRRPEPRDLYAAATQAASEPSCEAPAPRQPAGAFRR